MQAVASRVRPAAWAGAGGERHRAQLGGARMCWVEAGAGSSMLFLHGYAGSAYWWRRNLADLSAIRRVYAPDLPGFGGSRLRRPFTLAGAVETLAEWMAARGIACADVVAHSMGGQVALLLAARYPERVRSLVLAAPAGIPFDTGLVGIAWRASRSRRAGDPRFTPLVVASAWQAGPRVLWQAVSQIRSQDVRPALADVRAPVLILWGEQDRLLPARHSTLFLEAITGARVRIVPGGHNLMFDRPAMFNQAVRAFVTEVRVE
jgi:pimeloyl-ACP methyl ester carboxylesterase